MVVVIHQPHFMPWLGYLHRMAQADLFVLLDHVQFERGNYQNRTRIRIGDEARWLTVPVVQHSQKERIVDKEIDNRLEGERWWPRVHFSTLRHAYRDAGYFGTYASALQEVLHRRWEKLAQLNQAMLDVLREAFGIRTPLVRSSELQLEGSKSDLILNICRTVGATTLLAGFGGSRTYLDAQAFAKAGVKIAYHEFEHPVYEQGGKAPFIAGLSSIDLLLRRGPQSARLLLGERTTYESCAAA
jgi:WbqC-like protein family